MLPLSSIIEAIEEIGIESLSLPDPISDRMAMQKLCDPAINAPIKRSLKKIHNLGKILSVISDYSAGDVNLAGRIFNHDLENIRLSVQYATYTDGAQVFPKGSEEHLLNLRAIGSAMAYLANSSDAANNRRFLNYIPSSHFTALREIAGEKVGFSLESKVDRMSNVVYLAVAQLTKNSPGPDVYISILDRGDFKVYSVRDNCPSGIVADGGEPLTPFSLPIIFTEYSSKKEGGLGLQIVKRVAEMEKGFVIVTTGYAPDGKMPYGLTYDTRKRMATAISYPGPGTSFSIYIPN